MDETKNPKRVQAGKAGARKRWGDEPRVVRLDDLSQAQRRLVLALIEAAREANVAAARNAHEQVRAAALAAGTNAASSARRAGETVAAAIRKKKFDINVTTNIQGREWLREKEPKDE